MHLEEGRRIAIGYHCCCARGSLSLQGLRCAALGALAKTRESARKVGAGGEKERGRERKRKSNKKRKRKRDQDALTKALGRDRFRELTAQFRRARVVGGRALAVVRALGLQLE